jgi:hypothetical protein
MTETTSLAPGMPEAAAATDRLARDGYNSHPLVGQWGFAPPARITRLGGSRDGAPQEQGFS